MNPYKYQKIQLKKSKSFIAMLNKLKIYQKIIALIACLILIVIVSNIKQLSTLRQLKTLEDASAKGSQDALGVSEDSHFGIKLYGNIANMIINRDDINSRQKWEIGKIDADSAIGRLRKIAHTPDEIKIVDETEKISNEIKQIVDGELIPLLFGTDRKGREEAIMGIDGRIDGLLNSVEMNFDSMTSSINAEQLEGAKAFDNKSISATRLTFIMMVLWLIVGIVISIYFTRNISGILTGIKDEINSLLNAIIAGKLKTRARVEKINFEFQSIPEGINSTLDAITEPLFVAADYVAHISVGDIPVEITQNYNGDFNDIKNNLNALIRSENLIIEKSKLIAEGDLTVDVKKRSENDQLMGSLNEMVKSTAKVISQFQLAAENISSSSQQMSSTAQEMSQGATEQASSAEEASSSMEEMAANIQQNTENAQQTQKIALNAADGITKVAEAAQVTLKNIEDIADKVSIIGEIARQTNILALNAAVEAARAGEHGKGFAVVAAEVRKLAERSQLSAVEIDTLTKTSVRLTEDAGKMMAAIVPEISKTARLVQEIAASSLEQNSGADQVNNAIQQLNQVTQQNAAASEEVATSSEELSSQAEQLLDSVRFFKLNDSTSSGKQATAKYKPVHHVNVANTSTRETQYRHPVNPKKSGFTLKMDKSDTVDNEYEKF
jgi:methyl-accepting chemotaxis protein